MPDAPVIDHAPDASLLETQPVALTIARRLALPFERFLSTEAAAGILLRVASIAALVWANSPWRSTYESLLRAPVGVRLGEWTFEHIGRFWVSDGLMVLFFFVVGLELKREISGGELRDLRRAALPALAALGGMLAPAGIYLLFTVGTPQDARGRPVRPWKAKRPGSRKAGLPECSRDLDAPPGNGASRARPRGRQRSR